MILHLLNRPRLARIVKTLLSGTALCTLWIAGCGPKSQEPAFTPPQPLPVQTFTRQWSTPVGTGFGKLTRVYTRENFVFAYTTGGTAFIIDRNDGRIIATNHIANASRAGSRLHAPVLLKESIVYPTSTTLEIYHRDGSYDRSKQLSYSVRSDAVGTGNLVFFGADYSGGGRLVEIDLNQPGRDHKWEIMFPHASISATPVVMGDTVYAAGEDGDVIAVSTETKEPVWTIDNSTFRTYSAVVADLVADEANLYVASTDHKLVCLARNSARVKWQYTADDELRDAPAVTKDMVFQFVPGTGLAALAKDAGEYNRKPKWINREVTQYLAIDDRYVYGRRHDNAIVAMDKSTGQVVFSSRRPDYIAFAPNLTGDIIYAATSRGRVLAVKPVLAPGGMGELVLEPVPHDPIAAAR